MARIGRVRVIEHPAKHSRFTKVGNIPANVSVTRATPLRISDIEPDDMVITGRRGIFLPRDLDAELEKRAVSKEAVQGSLDERLMYRELAKRNIPFDFQTSLMGARPSGTPLGGLIADFVLLDRPLIIQVQGGIWHEGREAELRDILNADEAKRRGWETVFAWDYIIRDEELLERWFKLSIYTGWASAMPSNATRIAGRTNG